MNSVSGIIERKRLHLRFVRVLETLSHTGFSPVCCTYVKLIVILYSLGTVRIFSVRTALELHRRRVGAITNFGESYCENGRPIVPDTQSASNLNSSP